MAEFPVLVTGTTQWVVWVEAEDAADAHKAIEGVEHEWIEKEQSVDGWLEAETDVEETAHFIWTYGSQFLPQHDAHVHTHRWALLPANQDGRS